MASLSPDHGRRQPQLALVRAQLGATPDVIIGDSWLGAKGAHFIDQMHMQVCNKGRRSAAVRASPADGGIGRVRHGRVVARAELSKIFCILIELKSNTVRR